MTIDAASKKVFTNEPNSATTRPISRIGENETMKVKNLDFKTIREA